LRFTGWHRYKATNAIDLVYQGDRIVTDVLAAEPIRWLPVGRSLFRDKRIPRENLNGLLIENSGWSAALHRLTGMGSAWAQDPPHYAEVIDFQPGQSDGARQVDSSHTRLADWRGWQHDRWIYFYHDGPLVVVDQATGPATQHAGLSWHLLNPSQPLLTQGRMRLRQGDQPVTLHLIPLQGDSVAPDIQTQAAGDSMTIIYGAPAPGELQVASLFLPGRWAAAEVRVEQTATQPLLRITTAGEEIVIWLDPP
jgi:hypothetical protein